MTPETETTSSAAGRNGEDGSDAKITFASEMSESSSSNGGRGRGRGVHSGKGSHQGRDGRGG